MRAGPSPWPSRLLSGKREKRKIWHEGARLGQVAYFLLFFLAIFAIFLIRLRRRPSPPASMSSALWARWLDFSRSARRFRWCQASRRPRRGDGRCDPWPWRSPSIGERGVDQVHPVRRSSIRRNTGLRSLRSRRPASVESSWQDRRSWRLVSGVFPATRSSAPFRPPGRPASGRTRQRLKESARPRDRQYSTPHSCAGNSKKSTMAADASTKWRQVTSTQSCPARNDRMTGWPMSLSEGSWRPLAGWRTHPGAALRSPSLLPIALLRRLVVQSHWPRPQGPQTVTHASLAKAQPDPDVHSSERKSETVVNVASSTSVQLKVQRLDPLGGGLPIADTDTTTPFLTIAAGMHAGRSNRRARIDSPTT